MSSESRISLRIPAAAANVNPDDHLKPGHSSAILVKLNDSVVNDLRKAATSKERLQFVAGNSPKLRIGDRTIDLTLTPDAFRTELYASTTTDTSTTNDYTFHTLLSHRAEVQQQQPSNARSTDGADAALAALQDSLASYEQERAAKQVNIAQGVLPAPGNRYEAARFAKKESRDRRRGLAGSQGNVPLVVGSPSLNATSTSSRLNNAGAAGTGGAAAPLSDDAVKVKAMRTPIAHLLAMKPASFVEIKSKTHVPQADLEALLPKMGKQSEGKWMLLDRTYKELDVWKFRYQSSEDRQTAVDNAVRAYDRMRVGKDEKLWQNLLPVKERGKGICLSRLHLGGQQQQPANNNSSTNKGLTPHRQTSPPDAAAAGTGTEGKPTSMASTPRMGASTPRPNTSSNADMKKRLLSKNPQKARAAELEKEKKRKERTAAASDREQGRPAKRQATEKTKKNASSNFKSAEFVHSSDDESEEEEGELSQAPPKVKPTSASEGKKAASSANVKSKSAALKSKGSSSDSSDVPIKTVKEASAAAAAKAKAKAADSKSAGVESATKAKTSTVKAGAKSDAPASSSTTAAATAKANNSKTAALGKSTPKPNSSNLSAPSSAQHRSSTATAGNQRSPIKNADSRPTVPSPLGAARPRIASDVSDRSAVGVVSSKNRPAPTTSDSTTTRGLGITTSTNSKDKDKDSNAVNRKRNDTVMSSGNNKNDKNDNDTLPIDSKHKTSTATSPLAGSATKRSAPASPHTTAPASSAKQASSKVAAPAAGSKSTTVSNAQRVSNSTKSPLANGTTAKSAGEKGSSADKSSKDGSGAAGAGGAGLKRKAEAAGITPERGERSTQGPGTGQGVKHRKTDSQLSVQSQTSVASDKNAGTKSTVKKSSGGTGEGSGSSNKSAGKSTTAGSSAGTAATTTKKTTATSTTNGAHRSSNSSSENRSGSKSSASPPERGVARPVTIAASTPSASATATKQKKSQHTPSHSSSSSLTSTSSTSSAGSGANPANSMKPAHKANSASGASSTAAAAVGNTNKKATATNAINNKTKTNEDEDEEDEVLKFLSYSQGVALGEQFKRYYPKYEKLYDELQAKIGRGDRVTREEKGRLWDMHRRLVQMKREIGEASLREFASTPSGAGD